MIILFYGQKKRFKCAWKSVLNVPGKAW